MAGVRTFKICYIVDNQLKELTEYDSSQIHAIEKLKIIIKIVNLFAPVNQYLQFALKNRVLKKIIKHECIL